MGGCVVDAEVGERKRKRKRKKKKKKKKKKKTTREWKREEACGGMRGRGRRMVNVSVMEC